MNKTFINALMDALIVSTIAGDVSWKSEGINKFAFTMPFERDSKTHTLKMNVGSVMNPESKLPTLYFSLEKFKHGKAVYDNKFTSAPEIIISMSGLPDGVDIGKKIALLFGYVYTQYVDKNIQGLDKKYVMDHMNPNKTSSS